MTNVGAYMNVLSFTAIGTKRKAEIQVREERIMGDDHRFVVASESPFPAWCSPSEQEDYNSHHSSVTMITS